MQTCRLLALVATSALGGSVHGQCELQQLFHVTEAGPYGTQAMLGTSVAIDGDRILAGAPGEGAQSDGAVLVFERFAAAWMETARLIAAPPPGDRRFRSFGCDVALEGDRALVGAKDQGAGDLFAAGAAYLFEKGPLGWTSVFGLAPSVRVELGEFGSSVALAGDLAFVGAWSEGYPEPSGAVYVFERSTPGNWVQRQRLTPSAAGDRRFGADIAVDGDHVLIGASGTFDQRATGAAYVFERNGGQWIESQRLLPPVGFLGTGFGSSVALDGGRALVGAPGATDVTPGSTHCFERGPAGWNHVAELTPRNPYSLYLGTSVALRGDMAVVGAYAHEDQVHEAGTGWLFVRTATGWEERGKLADPSPSEYERAGTSVAIGADATAVVGIPGDRVDDRQEKGSVLVWSASSAGCSTLSGSPASVSLSAGGVQDYLLEAPPSSAGSLYLLLASERGTAPGIRLSSVHLPLNPGAALRFSLRSPNSPPFGNSLGHLDSKSEASARFTVPPLSDPGLIGLKLHFAFLTFPVTGPLLPPSGSSNATVLELRP